MATSFKSISEILLSCPTSIFGSTATVHDKYIEIMFEVRIQTAEINMEVNSSVYSSETWPKNGSVVVEG